MRSGTGLPGTTFDHRRWMRKRSQIHLGHSGELWGQSNHLQHREACLVVELRREPSQEPELPELGDVMKIITPRSRNKLSAHWQRPVLWQALGMANYGEASLRETTSSHLRQYFVLHLPECNPRRFLPTSDTTISRKLGG